MQRRAWPYLVFVGLASTCSLVLGVKNAIGAGPLPQVVEFNRDIRPILSNNCFACHGPDKHKRKADLRLDTETGAFADLGGNHALVPGKLDQSELFQKITAKDIDERMPPRKFGKTLTKRQIDLIRRWIEQGAKWQKHWSLIAPKRPVLPEISNNAWPSNPIDYFILHGLDQEGLRPSPEADKRTLLRRLSFDVTGLPPAPEEIDHFVADKSLGAYEKAVDRLLTSPHCGERLAMYWLDLVRYADTNGYHGDNHRDISLYRDYVIKAFNSNKSFDRFTIEQLAGDLLPQATTEQRIASGYNRLLMTTREGGAQPREYLAKYAADRVRNVSSVWLGATLGCTECHDHKFDPYKTNEFYRFAAFFADLKETAVGMQERTKIPSAEQAALLEHLNAEMSPLQKTLSTQTPELDAAQAKWEQGLRSGGTQGLPKEIAALLALDQNKRTTQQKQALSAHYRRVAPQLEPLRKQLADLQRKKEELLQAIPQTLTSMAVPARVIRVLPRGNWLSDAGPVVTPGVPASLSPLRVKDRRATRLDLARWLVARDHPMVARVFVNRLWKLAFGQGIVRTLDDFGSQGTWPTHPQLLDWLAVELMDSGWDVKHIVKLLVMSRTYRQTSYVTPQLRQHDPYNHWLARQARFRLEAEMVRDNALAVSGLLVRKIGGRSVRPYQPAGYWSHLNFPTREYQKDQGPAVYRRGLYTYWCRTFLHPSLLAFDASTREECTVARPRSNTPQQALVLLNDPTYVEAARTLAERMVRQGGSGNGPRIQFAYRQALCRKARPEEVQLLDRLYQKHVAQYRADQNAASAILAIGDRPVSRDLDAAELAAWTSVARVILNLHETIGRN